MICERNEESMDQSKKVALGYVGKSEAKIIWLYAAYNR